MWSLPFGVALFALACVMLVKGKPGSDGKPVAFLRNNSVADLYALAFTAAFVLGITFTVSGTFSIVRTIGK